MQGSAFSRRVFLKSAAAAAALPLAARGAQSVPRKPNLIFILLDDLGWGDLGVYGQDKFRTPSIDRMAAEGMRLANCYSGAPVCAPSRCTLMTGLHTGHCRVRDNFPRTPLLPENLTVAEHLKTQGYATALIGKWGLGEPDTSGIPNRKGFDEFVGFLNQAQAHTYYPETIWRNTTQVPPGGYTTDVFTAEALDFIRRRRDEPFFLYLAYQTPHADLEVPQDSLGEYLGEPWAQGSQGAKNAAYAAMLTRVDGDIGRLFALLAELDLDEDTLVLFSGDNGHSLEGGQADIFGSSGPFRGAKRTMYEGGIHVPTFARWPGRIAAGSVSDHLCAFWDLLPTAAQLAGSALAGGGASSLALIGPEPTPPPVDGIGFLPALLGLPGQREHKHLYWEWAGRQAVRVGKWKGLRERPDQPLELYDLVADIGEQNNVAADHPDVVAQLVRVIEAEHVRSPIWPLPGE